MGAIRLNRAVGGPFSKEGGGEGNEDLAEEGGVVLGLGGLLAGLGIGALVGGRLKTEDWHDIALAKH